MDVINISDASLGADYLGHSQCRFLVWAPKVRRIAVHLVAPRDRVIPLAPCSDGYFSATLDGIEPGARYFFRLDGQRERPDPASRHQPEDVHGPSEVVSPEFNWTDHAWHGMGIADYVIYELHVGTFTPAGTFESAIDRLDELVQLGITAVQIMPIAQFPGARNWGYDGVYPFAPQTSYGGPQGFKALVNACHQRGLAVVLDVVYNHLGPEGNYLAEFGHYFSEHHRTPWGYALNFDGPHSDEVRRYFIENSLYWIIEFHIDALRLDAVHAIVDQSARHFLRELGEAVHAQAARLGRPAYMIAESNRNDPVIVRPRSEGGYGLDGQYLDDFPRSLHALLTGERHGPYRDYARPSDFGKAYREGFVLTGQYSHYRRRPHGASSQDIPAERFMVFAQNHDAVGNRLDGKRLSQLIGFEDLKLAAGALLLAPYVPALFMGEEYGETAPFYYFISHHDRGLVQSVREGRRRELAFGALEPPDPFAKSTFASSRLDHALKSNGQQSVLWNFHQELLQLRRELAPIKQATRVTSETLVDENHQVLTSRRWHCDCEICVILHFGSSPIDFDFPIPQTEGRELVERMGNPSSKWKKMLDSAAFEWQGPGSQLPDSVELPGKIRLQPRSCLLLERICFGHD